MDFLISKTRSGGRWLHHFRYAESL